MRFLILCQPRSRSKWMSEYLSFDGARVGHDLMLGCSSVREFEDRVDSYDGSVETSIALGHKLWSHRWSRARMIIVHRTTYSVGRSFEQLGLRPDWLFLYQQDQALSELMNAPSTAWLSYESLSTARGRSQLCDLTGTTFSLARDREYSEKNIQINVSERLKELSENSARISAFNADLGEQLVLLANSADDNITA